MRILLAVDGSSSADRALDLVAALPWHDGGRVRIVSVAPESGRDPRRPWSLAATTDAIETEEADAPRPPRRPRRRRTRAPVGPWRPRHRTGPRCAAAPRACIVEEARADAGRPHRHRSSRARRAGNRRCSGRSPPRWSITPRVRSSSRATIGSVRSSSPTTGRPTPARPRPSCPGARCSRVCRSPS